jgi:hypothetical protein
LPHLPVSCQLLRVPLYPTLEFEGITQEDVSALATTYQTLKSAGAMTAQDADEDSFREKLSLPELEQSGIRQEPALVDPNLNPKDPNNSNNQNNQTQPSKASEHDHTLKKTFQTRLSRSASSRSRSKR